jgi:hypothetical protein
MKRALIALSTAALLMMAGVTLISSTAAAATKSCATGVNPGNVSGTLIIGSGVDCNVQGDTISGNVTLNPGGTLVLGGGSLVKGNFTASGAGSVTANPLGSGAFTFSIVMCNSSLKGLFNITGSSSLVLIGEEEGCGPDNIGRNVNLASNKGGLEMFGGAPSPGTCSAPGGTCVIGGNVSISSNSGTTEDDDAAVEFVSNLVRGTVNCTGNAGVISESNSAQRLLGQCGIA